MSMPCSRHQN